MMVPSRNGEKNPEKDPKARVPALPGDGNRQRLQEGPEFPFVKVRVYNEAQTQNAVDEAWISIELQASCGEVKMDYLPIFFSLTHRECLVVGGGAVARRKVDLLLKAGGRVTVISPKLEPTLAELVAEGRIRHLPEVFHGGALKDMSLVISATEKKEVNRQVAEAAHQAHLPINVVDDPELCSFILPAIVDRSPVVVAVSSGGRSPVLARLLKARLESLVPSAYGRLADLAGELRAPVKQAFSRPEDRRKFWERNFQGPVARVFLAGREQEARGMLEQELKAQAQGAADASTRGMVTFIDAEMRDPELLTLKALRHLQEADVLVHDPGVLGEILDMARRDAQRIVTGTLPGQVSCAPAEVPALLVRLAGAGNHVVRLRTRPPGRAAGGDSETMALDRDGLMHQRLPGVTGPDQGLPVP